MVGSVHRAGLPETFLSTAQGRRQGSKMDAGREHAAPQRAQTLTARTPWYGEAFNDF